MRIYRPSRLLVVACFVLLPQYTAPAQDPSPKPENAISLFDGSGLEAWTKWAGILEENPPPAPAWPIEDGKLKLGSGAERLGTTRAFGAVNLHLEYMIPAPSPRARKPLRIAGAAILPDGTKLLIGNSFSEPSAPYGRSSGAIEGFKAADRNASRPPETWQTLDLRWKPASEVSGKPQPAQLRVHWNGVLVHDDVALPSESKSSSVVARDGTTGQIGLDARGGTLFFRNIWVVDESPQAKPTPAKAGLLKLHPVFQDHMVLQRAEPIPVFGSAPAGAEVSVSLSPNLSAHAKANASGAWSAELPAQEAGGPFTLQVASGEHKLQCQGVLIGDVWLASGQSNMHWALSRTASLKESLARADIAQLRLATVPRTPKVEGAATQVPVSWKISSAEAAREFSAVGWHFGRHLNEKLGIPIGIVHASVGGTPVEAWMSESSLLQDPVQEFYAERNSKAQLRYRNQLRKWRKRALAAKAQGKDVPVKPKALRIAVQRQPSALWNGMIAPLKRLKFRVVIWYQGESNATRAWQYRRLFRTMIQSWRKVLGKPELPFLFVQLANFSPREKGTWPELRQAQAEALRLPATGMAVAIDIGTSKNIHPKNKKSVGERLGLLAERIAYGREVVAEGPTLVSVKRSSSDPGALELEFRSTAGWEEALAGQAITGLEIASDQGPFFAARATIVAPNKLRVNATEVKKPKWVRYAWSDDPKANLKNGAGLPAPPFRTDNQPWKTRSNGQ